MSITPRELVTPQLKEWITKNALSGHDFHSILKQMTESGWQEKVAIDVLNVTLTRAYAKPGESCVPPPQPQAVPVPMPALDTSPCGIRAIDRTIRVLSVLRKPQIAVFGNVLSVSECKTFIDMARGRLTRSQTVNNKTGGTEVHSSRTSEGMFFKRGENELVARIEERIAALINWPVENGEGLQVLRYGEGAEYKPHYDYFIPDEPGTPAILKLGGQRVASVVMYLNTPRLGGGTVFPDLQLEVAAQRGNAVFFSYDRPHPATQTLHGGAPVISGEKWVLTKWVREGVFPST
jgi:prolyl 4-hydroxylase